ncbi:hypothetical protein OSG_eHP14_00195 [environmental Halophage eHP-14]|nr:hypothetical protein OSG_eHP14_00195 [environmental Halophage eHP-14]
MTGAGSSTVAFVPEDSYNTTPGSPTYYLPGQNVQVETSELSRNLARLAAPTDVEDSDAVAQRVDGQLDVSFVLNSDDFHRIVFNNASNTGFTSGAAASCEWYLGVDLSNGTTVERQIQGWAPQTMTVNYQGTTDSVRVSLSGLYAEEDTNTSITPGTIENTSTGDEVPGHGAKWEFDSTTVSKLQSATLTISNISRAHFGSTDPVVQDVVTGDVNSELQATGIFEGSTWLEYALGSSGASSVEDFVNSVSSTITFDHDGTTIADYSFSNAKPRNYNWQDLVARGSDLTEPITWWASDVTASDPTA